jgi:hypothetical protein
MVDLHSRIIISYDIIETFKTRVSYNIIADDSRMITVDVHIGCCHENDDYLTDLPSPFSAHFLNFALEALTQQPQPCSM